MPDTDDGSKLFRPLLLAGIGVVLILLAIGLNLFLWGSEDAPPPPRGESAAPSVAAPSGGKAPGMMGASTARDGATGPSFDVVRVNPKGDAVMAGRGAPNARIVILDGDKVIGEVTADERGEWVFVPQTPLSPGTRNLTLRMELPDGSLIESDKAVVLIVPEAGKDIAGRPGAGEPLAVQVPRDGSGPSRLLQGPSEGVRGQRGLTLDTLDYDAAGSVTVSGRGEPSAEIRLYIDNKMAARTRVGGTGIWIGRPERQVAPGLHDMRADQVDDAGRVLSRLSMPFSRAEPLEMTGGPGFVIVQPGNSLWRLARQTYGTGFDFTLIFEANKEQIKDPDKIYPGQVFSLPPIN